MTIHESEYLRLRRASDEKYAEAGQVCREHCDYARFEKLIQDSWVLADEAHAHFLLLPMETQEYYRQTILHSLSMSLASLLVGKELPSDI